MGTPMPRDVSGSHIQESQQKFLEMRFVFFVGSRYVQFYPLSLKRFGLRVEVTVGRSQICKLLPAPSGLIFHRLRPQTESFLGVRGNAVIRNRRLRLQNRLLSGGVDLGLVGLRACDLLDTPRECVLALIEICVAWVDWFRCWFVLKYR
jgi:hypothetical protein